MSKSKQKRIVHAAMTTDRIIATQERKRSGAAGSHDSRPNRERTRAAAKAAAMRDA